MSSNNVKTGYDVFSCAIIIVIIIKGVGLKTSDDVQTIIYPLII